jgi:hypothetical protein
MDIPGKRKGHTRDMQGTYDGHTRDTLKIYLLYVPSMYLVCPQCVPCIYLVCPLYVPRGIPGINKGHTKYILGTYKGYMSKIQWTYYDHPRNILGIC